MAKIGLSGRTIVPNRIFLAYQWINYRTHYEKICAEIHKAFPVYFYAIGRPKGVPAEALLEKIKGVMLSSTAAVFDASRGNPNVSLEYGLAHFVPSLQQYLLIEQNTLPNQVNVGTPIITDLAGAAHNQWNLSDLETLKDHLETIAVNHLYTKRFKNYCRTRRLVKGQFRTPLKVIRLFDEKETILRREVIDQLVSSSPQKKEKDVEVLLSDMHKAGLITITAGREWASTIRIS